MERFDGVFFEQLLARSFAADLSYLPKKKPLPASSPVWGDRGTLLQQNQHLRQGLMTADSVQDVLQLCIETALGFPGIAWGAGYVVDERSAGLDLVAEVNVPDAVLPAIEHYPPSAHMSLHVKAGHPLHLVRTGDHSVSSVTSMSVLPILNDGRAVACLTLASVGQTVIPPRTRRVLEGITDYAGIVIARIIAEERAKKVQDGQEEMLTLLIHSLKTPLAIMHGYIDLLLSRVEEGEHPLKQDRILRKVMLQSERVSALITDLLDLEEIASDALLAECGAYPINEIVEQIVERLGDEGNGRIVLQLSEEEALIEAEELWIARAIKHVIINAIRFSSDPVLVQVRSVNSDVVVDVIDHGVGISPEALPHVFDRFYHTSYLPTGSPNPGVGLGLTLASEIIKRFHGSITVTSTLDHGSCFSILLPLA